MVSKPYDETDPSSIETYAKRLVGRTLKTTKGTRDVPIRYLDESPGVRTKGVFGTLVERHYFGITPGNMPCSPDFKRAGVELKTTALERRKKGLTAKERLVLQMIDYSEIVNETYESSCFMKKSQLMLLISNEYQNDRPIVDSEILMARLINLAELPPADRHIIREDWQIIAEKVCQGLAHELSGSDTTYLEACTKGMDGSRLVKQPNSQILAKPRGFAFKSGYVTSLVREWLNDVESLAITDDTEVAGRGFERTIIERFSPFIGRTTDEIESILGTELNPAAKGYRATLARRVMGVSAKNVEEFDRSGISMKTILIDEQGRPPESMSFPVFRYMGPGSVLEEDWESDEDDEMPRIKRILEDTRFLFVVFQRSSGRIRLKEVKFWSMTSADIETYVKPVWEATRKSIELGKLPDLPKGSFNGVCHVRPHAANKKDTSPSPLNGEQVKKCFWLDRRYIQRQVSGSEQLSLT